MLKAYNKNYIEDLRSFSFLGDPGCDGLGAEIMSIAMGAINDTRDFILQSIENEHFEVSFL